MKGRTILIAVSFFSSLSFLFAQSQFKVIGYLPTWAGYPNSINNVPLTKLTHINIAFANPDINGNVVGGGSVANIATVVNAAHAKNVKVLMSLGGAGAPGSIYKSVLTNIQTTFVNNIVQYVLVNNLDGIDVDIEGDVLDGTTLTAAQYQSFITQLGTSLQAQGKLMTAALASWFAGYVTNTAASKFDFINIMAYDSTGSPWGSAGQHSTYAYALSNFTYWNTTKGIAAAKLNIGVPFYGYCWGTYNTANGDAMSYCSIITKYPGAENNDQVGSGANRISYNGMPTISKKTKYAVQNAGGIMIWELTQDCSNGKSLLNVIDSTIKSLTTSIDGDSEQDNFKLTIFPNPAKENATISLHLSRACEVAVSLFDVLGREDNILMEKMEEGDHQLKINTMNLNDGLYFIKVAVSGEQKMIKFIVNIDR